MKSEAPTPCRDALSRHQNLLEQHRDFLSSLQLESQTVPENADLLGQCLEHVHVMVMDIKKLSMVFVPSNRTEAVSASQTAANNKRSSKPNPGVPHMSSSGRSMTDTTPPRDDELLCHPQKSTVVRAKRRAPDEDEENKVHVTVHDHSQEGRRHKKPRTGTSDTRRQVQSENFAEDSDERKIERLEKTVELSAHEDSFVREVQQALREKELKRLEKLNKKRKRESGTSDVSMLDVGPGNGKPRKKRQKASQPDAEAAESVSQSTAQSGETTPQREKGTAKRLSPAAEYIGSILQQVQERRRNKRPRTSVA